MASEEPIATEPRRVLTRCDGYQLRGVVETATAWLIAHAHEVDALNCGPLASADDRELTRSLVSPPLRVGPGYRCDRRWPSESR